MEVSSKAEVTRLESLIVSDWLGKDTLLVDRSIVESDDDEYELSRDGPSRSHLGITHEEAHQKS